MEGRRYLTFLFYGWETANRKCLRDRQSGSLLGTITSYLLDKAVLGKECASGATASKNRVNRNKQTQPLHLARVEEPGCDRLLRQTVLYFHPACLPPFLLVILQNPLVLVFQSPPFESKPRMWGVPPQPRTASRWRIRSLWRWSSKKVS